jgi:hypothetical protein
MSQRDVERAFGRLLTDDRFRQDFYQDPERACIAHGIYLTQDEMEAIVATPKSALAQFASRLDDRICRLHIDREGPSDHTRMR